MKEVGLRFGNRKKFFSKRVEKHWNRLPKKL